MMKRMIFAALLAMTLTACGAPSQQEAQTPVESTAPAVSTPAESTPVEEDFPNPGGQGMATNAYSAIMESFGVGADPDIPQENFYPEEFADAYLGDDNFLYVCLTDTSGEVLDRYRALVPEPRILRFVEVEHSCKDLYALYMALVEIEGLDFSFVGTDVMDNEVDLGIPDISKEAEVWDLIETQLPTDIRALFDELPITIEESPYATLA